MNSFGKVALPLVLLNVRIFDSLREYEVAWVYDFLKESAKHKSCNINYP